VHRFTGDVDLDRVMKSLEEIKLSATVTKEELKKELTANKEELTANKEELKKELTAKLKEELTANKEEIKEELTAKLTANKDEIKEELTAKLTANNQPQVSKSYSEIGSSALKGLKDAMLIKKFYGEGPSIMTFEDLREMANLADEYESNCYVQCKLVPIFNEIGLVVVNSERPGFEWL